VGYRLWWIRRPAQGGVSPVQTLVQSWLALSRGGRLITLILALLIGLALPVLGISLLLFIAIDVVRWRWASAAQLQPEQESGRL
jgi:uncharacterized iron-regulated membrane protein